MQNTDFHFDELEFFARMKHRPGVFLGNISLMSLRDHLFGMDHAFRLCHQDDALRYFFLFTDWYQNEIIKDWNGYACWWNHLLYVSGNNDAAAFFNFYKAFEQYLLEQHNLKLPEVEERDKEWSIYTIHAKMTLMTHQSQVIVPMQLECCVTEGVITAIMEISVQHDGKTYQAKGNDEDLVSAFVALQRELPQDVKLACCMTCRHGNMCPCGGEQVFCTKDIVIRSKQDMCDLFDQTDPFSERMVDSFHYCDDFEHQSKDCYTYNDYLYQL